MKRKSASLQDSCFNWSTYDGKDVNGKDMSSYVEESKYDTKDVFFAKFTDKRRESL